MQAKSVHLAVNVTLPSLCTFLSSSHFGITDSLTSRGASKSTFSASPSPPFPPPSPPLPPPPPSPPFSSRQLALSFTPIVGHAIVVVTLQNWLFFPANEALKSLKATSSPATGLGSPVSGLQSPVTGYRLPVTDMPLDLRDWQ
ncbi:hypothetical protein TcWFU_006055 [Taenia crassiceps]|uniref:Uncharacterized protein n=1 Tax=Taenia crassiceps TaxID=6207 RepID=A0ABR4Q797_9CEST